jgi:signal transduction histidine kinase
MNGKAKIALIAILIAGITFLHYSAKLSERHYFILYQGLYYFPLIPAGFWFGLWGVLRVCLIITLLYGPFIMICWEGFSQTDFGRIMEVLHYCMVALILGILRDREQAEQKRVRQAESLAAIGEAMSGVAHDIKTPLIVAGKGLTFRVVMPVFDKTQ